STLTIRCSLPCQISRLTISLPCSSAFRNCSTSPSRRPHARAVEVLKMWYVMDGTHKAEPSTGSTSTTK
ncbi:unnamed protein product, partial [Ascophyllum nodosum]